MQKTPNRFLFPLDLRKKSKLRIVKTGTVWCPVFIVANAFEKERIRILTNEIIKIENLNKTFLAKDKKIVALDNINLTIKRGEIFGIIGLSGAGKSTLVRCINFLEEPTEGNVIFEGQNLGKLNKRDLLKARRSMAMIFQNFNLLSQRNALQNVCFPMEIAGVPKSEAKKRAEELLKVVGLADRMTSYPSQMSGGQKQRVAIARALSTNPSVLLCDEATSALDPNTTAQILELLKKINRELGITIVIITHEMKVIESICHRVAVIDDSHIVELGDVKEVFLHPKSKIARQLIFPHGDTVSQEFTGGTSALRIVFDGTTAFEPIISQLTLECRAMVNIVAANTKTVNDKVFGQMVIQLPSDKDAANRIMVYLVDKGIKFEEVTIA